MFSSSHSIWYKLHNRTLSVSKIFKISTKPNPKIHFRTHDLMRTYCLEAKKYGDVKIPDGVNPKTVTVILNPTANRRKAQKQFDKYCAPILNLSGLCVDVLLTESEGHARTLVEKLSTTDAIIIAGGDGTVSEVITGLFRRTEDDRLVNACPVGILPLGQTNSLGKGAV